MVNVLEICLKDNDEKNAGEIFEVFDGLFMIVSYQGKDGYTVFVNNVFMIGHSIPQWPLDELGPILAHCWCQPWTGWIFPCHGLVFPHVVLHLVSDE